MSAGKVDVLAVMSRMFDAQFDGAANAVPSGEFAEAHLAVADLIAKSGRLLDRTQMAELLSKRPGAIEEFREALARVQA